MWIRTTTKLPIVEGDYKVKVQMCDIPDEIDEDIDYFDGTDFIVYGRFVNEWFENITNE